MRRLMKYEDFSDCEGIFQRDGGKDECTRAEKHLQRYKEELFSSVLKSMFTVFRCFTDGCSSSDGTPLITYFWDTYGLPFIGTYILITVFVLFGLFNLIMAVFVENTLEYARTDQQKRQQLRHEEHVRMARQLQKIILMICTRRGEGDLKLMEKEASKGSNTNSGGIFRYIKKSKSYKSVSAEYLDMQVSREIFEDVMQDGEVLNILEELEISVTDPRKLFDIIDSNGSNSLDLGELIEGLMKLRGPTDKGDAVESALMLRSTQRSLRKLELDIETRNKDWSAIQARILATLQNLENKLPPADVSV